MEKEFNVHGKIVINVELDIEATSEEDAIKKAIEDFKDAYNLEVHGYYHQVDQVEYDDIHAIEYEEGS